MTMTDALNLLPPWAYGGIPMIIIIWFSSHKHREGYLDALRNHDLSVPPFWRPFRPAFGKALAMFGRVLS